MTHAQLSALIDAEIAAHTPSKTGRPRRLADAEPGTAADLMDLGAMAARRV